jgi:hypothetical protein
MISIAIQAVLEVRGKRPLCDACVCDRLGLKLRQVASAAARMADRNLVFRFHGRCSGCCTTRRVTANAAREAATIAGWVPQARSRHGLETAGTPGGDPFEPGTVIANLL